MEQVILLLEEIKSLLGLDKDVLTLTEFAIYAGVSKNTVYKYTSERKVTFYRVGKLVYFKKEDVIEFLTKNSVASSYTTERKASNNLIS